MIIVNGKSINVQGNNISIINDIVHIDGKPVTDKLDGIVKIEYIGDLINLQSDCSVDVKGDVEGDIEAGGSVTCDTVGGDIEANGSVHCDDIEGNVKAGGSVNCGDINGNVKAGGSVNRGW